jgi:hypothetical protein
LKEASKVIELELPADEQSPEVAQPSEQAFDFPSSPVAPERAAILRFLPFPVAFVRRDQRHTVVFQSFVQRIGIVCPIPDQPLWAASSKAPLKGSLDKGDFMRASTCCVDGDRNTMAVCDCHDLGALATLGLPDTSAPFLAEANVPSMKHSLKSSLPRLRKSSAKVSSSCRNTPELTHAWNRRWQVWYGGNRSGMSCQRAPVRNIHSTPSNTARVSAGGLPRPSSLGLSSGNSGASTAHCSSVTWSRLLMPYGIGNRALLLTPHFNYF